MAEYTLFQLAEWTNSELQGDPNYVISGIEDLDAASELEAAFLENPRYASLLDSSRAGVVFVAPDQKVEGRQLLINDHPSLAFQTVIERFLSTPSSGFIDIHPTAVVHESVQLGENVSIAPHVVIDQGAVIGAGTRIAPGVSVGTEVSIGTECLIHPNVTIREGSQIGNRVIIQPGAVIGSCGFGYFTDLSTGLHHKLAQLGIVVIEDDVEIGANTTIDRARFKTTTIRKGTKLDNLVQIAHQVELGEHNIIVSQVGIAGSTKTGHHVVMGGQVGVAGHIEITDGVTIASRAAVSKGIHESGVYSGIPAAPIREFNAHFVRLRSIGKVIQRLKELENKVKKLTAESIADQT